MRGGCRLELRKVLVEDRDVAIMINLRLCQWDCANVHLYCNGALRHLRASHDVGKGRRSLSAQITDCVGTIYVCT